MCPPTAKLHWSFARAWLHAETSASEKHQL